MIHHIPKILNQPASLIDKDLRRKTTYVGRNANSKAIARATKFSFGVWKYMLVNIIALIAMNSKAKEVRMVGNMSNQLFQRLTGRWNPKA